MRTTLTILSLVAIVLTGNLAKAIEYQILDPILPNKLLTTQETKVSLSEGPIPNLITPFFNKYTGQTVMTVSFVRELSDKKTLMGRKSVSLFKVETTAGDVFYVTPKISTFVNSNTGNYDGSWVSIDGDSFYKPSGSEPMILKNASESVPLKRNELFSDKSVMSDKPVRLELNNLKWGRAQELIESYFGVYTGKSISKVYFQAGKNVGLFSKGWKQFLVTTEEGQSMIVRTVSSSYYDGLFDRDTEELSPESFSHAPSLTGMSCRTLFN